MEDKKYKQNKRDEEIQRKRGLGTVGGGGEEEKPFFLNRLGFSPIH